MQLTKMVCVRNGATDLGPIGLPNLFAVGNIDRGWLIALAWTPEPRAEGESKMITFFGIIIYWCGLAIVCMCMLAALTIVAAILTNKLADSGGWIAAGSFVLVVGLSWLAGSRSEVCTYRHLKPSAAWSKSG
jgi:hypothetical protein